MLKLSMLALALFTSVPSAHAVEGPSDELRSLRNVINNSIPERYRDQLNGSLSRLEVAIQDGCHDAPAPIDNSAPQCKLAYSSGFYSVTKADGGQITGWEQNVSTTLAALDALIKARQCSVVASAACELAYSSGFYSVKRDGSQISGWDQNMNTTLAFMTELRKRGICK